MTRFLAGISVDAPFGSRCRSLHALLLVLTLSVSLAGCDALDVPIGSEPAADTSFVARLEQRPADGEPHVVRIVEREARLELVPSEVRARPQDVLRFAHTARLPASIRFDTAGLPAAAANALRRQRLSLGHLFVTPGQLTDVPLSDLPPGRYVFLTVPGGARGTLLIQPES